MQLHHLKGAKKSKKRIGRGGKRGTTSGRGTKGQKSRSGRKIRPAERDLLIRLPKRRGVKHGPTSDRPFAINTRDIDRMVEKGSISGGEISKKTLVDLGLISKNFDGNVKVLSGGTMKKAVIIRGLIVSKGAKKVIEKAGGKIVVEK